MKHLRKFNESWIEDMYNDLERNRKTPEEIEDERRQGAEIRSNLNKKEEEGNQSDPNFQFRQAVRAASRGDKQAHQKMIELLQVHGVDLIKDRRYLILKRAAELGKEEVMDVLFDALENAGEDTTELKKYLEEYVRASKG